MTIIKLVDRFLDQTNMFRVVLYYLAALLGTAFLLGFFGLLPHDPTAIAFSAVLITAVCWLSNRVFAYVFAVPANRESVVITALILVLILEPVTAADPRGVGILVFASVWAVASKFILAAEGRHMFNPAAFAVVLTAILLDAPATWWVAGNLTLLPVVLAGGVLVVRKIRRLDLVAVFLAAVLATLAATTPLADLGSVTMETLRSTPLFFFAFVMLTEPLTAPAGRWARLVFAALVGVLFTPTLHIGAFYITPELALLAGNFFAFVISPSGRIALRLERIEQAAADTYDFIFRSPQRLAFQAGQYLEWTLGTDRPDERGNRRYFTVASAPGDEDVRLGVKFYPEGSAFKRTLQRMQPGDTIHASPATGEFTLPRRASTKIAFIAGGIGITPFRSMLQDLVDRGEKRPIVMLYGVERPADIAYADVIDRAERELGIRTSYVVARDAGPGQHAGRITDGLVREAVPDFSERLFYISGPQAMVATMRRMLIGMGVRRSRIKTDFFPGFA